MIFNSYVFVLLFLPVFMISFHLMRHLVHVGKLPKCAFDLWIIAGSLVFYGLFGINNLAIISISILWNICTSIPMSFMRKHGNHISLFGKGIKAANIWLFIGIFGNLSLLLFFKFSNWMFPIAISFYTFNQIMYITDLNRGDIEEFHILDYLSFILFFPKLLQGPLMRFDAFKNEKEKSFASVLDWEKIMRGLLLFSIGLFKKVIMADTFGKAVDFAYGNVAGLGSLEAVLVAVFYSFQLYFDFSGYCDMASALCIMMNMELPLNFDSPYKAVNIMDFWKRWHITLTGFFTKYVYIPLGGNRKGAARMYLNIMIIFLLSGFWHGKGVTFIVWGAMHGVLFVFTRFIEKMGITQASKKEQTGDSRDSFIDKDKGLLKFVRVLLTFIYVTVAWVFFRASSVKEAVTLLGRVFTGGKKAIATGISSCFQLDELWYVLKVTPVMKLSFAWDVCLWLFVAVSAVMIFFCPNAVRRTKDAKLGVMTTLLTAFLLLWSIVSFSGVSTFLYMNF